MASGGSAAKRDGPRKALGIVVQVTIDKRTSLDNLFPTSDPGLHHFTKETHMPDFTALSKLFGGIKDLISGLTGFVGSVEGTNVEKFINGFGS